MHDDKVQTALDWVRWAHEVYGNKLIVASSMQDAVLVDLVSRVYPYADVAFLDTGYHFEETLETRDAIEGAYGINVRDIHAEHSVEQQDMLYGQNLFAFDPDSCCNMRKVEPMKRLLACYSAWLTGLRRAESVSRNNQPFLSWDDTFDVWKLNPIVDWSDDDVIQYIEDNDIIQNPLVKQGYPSIGCEPCTQKAVGSDVRSGRWSCHMKSECGMHGR